jgi:uncharacterized membrane protein
MQKTLQRTAGWGSWIIAVLALFYLILLGMLLFLPGGTVLERLRWLDSGICAQLPTHSFYPGGQQLPLCARNTGIYLGFIVTLITLYARKRGRTQLLPPWPIVIVLACGVIAMAVDGFNSFFFDLGLPHLYQPDNLLRLATGLLTGLTMATFLVPNLNRLFWRNYSEERSISSWRALLPFIPLLVLSFFVVASQNWLALYPLALLSTTGLLSALSSVNLIALIAVCRREQSFEHYRELLPFFSLALLLAIGELLLLAQLKLALLPA